MKKIFLLLSIFVSLIFVSCEKDLDSENLSRITYYPDFEIKGDVIKEIPGYYITLNPIGTAYTEPSAKATENETEITCKTTGTVDHTKVGRYEITYSATNKDGFDGEAIRTVLVYDNSKGLSENDISGTYSGSVTRTAQGWTTPLQTSIVINKLSKGIFTISDFISGYYAHRPDRSSAQAFPGYFQLTSTNEVVYIYAKPGVWTYEVTGINSTSYDPSTKVISYKLNWLTYTFEVSLKLNE